MNIFKTCETAPRGHVATAIVALLLVMPAAMRADDHKNKKGDSAQSKPAKQTASPSSGKTSTRGNGTNTTVRSGGTRNPSDSGDSQKTRHSDRVRSTNNTGGTSATGGTTLTHKEKKAAGSSSSTGGSTSTGNSGGTMTTGTSGMTHKERKAARATTNGTGGTTSTGDAGASGTSGKFGKRTNNTDATSSTTNPGIVRRTDGSVDNHTGRRSERSAESFGGANRISTAKPGITRGSNGKVEVFRAHNGGGAVFRRDGTVREVRSRNMTIIHLPGGSRRVVVDRQDRSRIVAYRGGYGYVQRPFVYRGREFSSRTYLYRGRPYAAYYQRYPYRGLYLDGYRPYRYYRPAFYGWAYNPWRSPVRYSWGWGGNPWYGYYGGYFTPYPTYSSASFWLTDFLIASSLQAAYQQRADDRDRAYFASNSGDQVVLTPEIKDAIAAEVQNQLALENSESETAGRGGDVDINSSGLPRILAEVSPNHPHIFVVSGPLEVTDGGGRECGLTAGDVLKLTRAPSPDSTTATLQVYASKNQECPRGTSVLVGLADLQEMQNNMRAGIDQGLQELQSHEGGLPAPPPSAAGAPVPSSFASIAPPPDANVSSEIQQQAREADTAEQGVLDELKQEDSSGGTREPNTTSNSPVQISVGQTIGEVVAAMGNPKQIVNLGAKKIYVYPNLKITFVNAKVTNVE